MSNDDELYISSLSPTITIPERRELLKITDLVSGILTPQEFKSVMIIYGHALDRIMKENGIEEEHNENKSS